MTETNGILIGRYSVYTIALMLPFACTAHAYTLEGVNPASSSRCTIGYWICQMHHVGTDIP